MDTSSIDTLLRGSAPRRASDDAAVAAELNRVGIAARVSATTRRRRVRRLSWAALPVFALPALALASTAGTDLRMVPDFEVPISYVTDTGKEITCTVEFFNGELLYVETNTEAVDFISAQDWDGVGQRIYDRALALEGSGGFAPWAQAENDVFLEGANEDLFRNGGMGTDSDCSGELH